jgi:hypothetical protein
MKIEKIKWLMILVIIAFALNSINAQETKTAHLSGIVTSKVNQKPLPGVTVSLIGTKQGAVSKQDGSFKIDNIKPGIYSVKFSYIGYETFVQTDVNINNANKSFLEIEMIDKVINLKGVEVKSNYFMKKVETSTSTQTLSMEEIRRAPGVQEDVIRAASLLPGVNVTSAGRNDLVVRGGAPFENLFVVDNIEVPNINHFGSQGSTGGPLSIVNIDFVKNVTFSSGAFGSKFGDRTSSITNIELRNGNDEFGGKATLSATGFGLNLEGPMGENGSFLFSARRSYLDFIFTAAGFSFVPEYWDFHFKSNYRIDEKNSVSFLTIGALGSVKLNNENADNKYKNGRLVAPSQNQYFSGLTWKHLFENGYSKVTLGETLSDYNTIQNDSNLVPILKNTSREAETSLKIDFDFQLTPSTLLTFGNQSKLASNLSYNLVIDGKYRLDELGKQNPLSMDTTFTALKNGTYANITTSFDKFKLTLGGRLDYYNYIEEKMSISPRATFIYQVNEVTAFSVSGGRYFQAPSYIWLMGDANNYKMKPIQADQIVLAFDHTPLQEVKVQVETYYKQYKNYPGRVWRPDALYAPGGFDDLTADIPFGLEPLNNEVEGYSRGVEIFIQKKLSEIPLYGLMSLTFGETKFTTPNGTERYSSYDTRFIGNLSLGYRITDDWEISGKFRISTGAPTTPFLVNGTKDWKNFNEGDRLPIFHSLDLRVDKRWNLSSIYVITYLDIQNVYSQKNVSGIVWDYRNQKEIYQSSLGILPTIGVSFEM